MPEQQEYTQVPDQQIISKMDPQQFQEFQQSINTQLSTTEQQQQQQQQSERSS